MTNTNPFGGIDLVELGINGNAILGIKESGKSYLGTEIGELFFDAGIPFITFDPIGIWHNMRYPGKGPGFPVVVAGGFHGDLPLTPENAPAIVEAAMKNRVSLVLDLFHPDLSKTAWRKIVKDCALLLLHKNSQYGLRHIFIEEAAEFVPQRPTDWQVYEAVERVIRMGGNSRLGCTLISPRSQEVNKAVLELCENMFLFRQRGKNALENLKKWLDVAGAASGDVIKSLPSMPTGECWAWLGGRDTPIHIKVPEKRSFHPNRRDQHGDATQPAKKAVDLGKFLTALQGTLAEMDEAAKAKDPKPAKATPSAALPNAELETLRRAAAKFGATLDDRNKTIAALIMEVARLEDAMIRVRGISCSDDLKGIVSDALCHDRVEKARVGGKSIGREAVIEQLINELTNRDLPFEVQTPMAAQKPVPVGKLKSTPAKIESTAGNSYSVGVVPQGCSKPLAALAGVYPAGMTEAQWATAAGYKRSGGTWKTYRSRLSQAAMIEQREGRWFVTDLGARSAGDVETPPPPGADLVRWWAGKLSGTPKIAEALIGTYPRAISNEELAGLVEMTAAGGSFKTYLSRLSSANLLERSSAGVRLSSDVMENV